MYGNLWNQSFSISTVVDVTCATYSSLVRRLEPQQSAGKNDGSIDLERFWYNIGICLVGLAFKG